MVAIRATRTYVKAWPVASQGEMLDLDTAIVGDTAIRSDLGDAVYTLVSTPPSTLGNWKVSGDVSGGASIAYVDAADGLLSAAIDAEEVARLAADDDLQGQIDSEVSDRSAADTAETSARTSADTTLQSNINTVS